MVEPTLLKNMTSSVGIMTFPIWCGKNIIHVPKHQPGMIKVPTAWGNNLRFLRDGGSTSLARDGSLNLDWLEMRRCSVWFDSIVSDPDFFHESTLCGGGLAYSSITLYEYAFLGVDEMPMSMYIIQLSTNQKITLENAQILFGGVALW